jgi:hypothetical protein
MVMGIGRRSMKWPKLVLMPRHEDELLRRCRSISFWIG